MRLIVSIIVFAFTASAVHAQSARIDRLELVAAGIFASKGETTRKSDPNISTGEISTTDNDITKVTNKIPAKVGTSFGVEFNIVGSPKGAIAPLKVIWKYPAPGIINPKTATPTLVDEYIDDNGRIGSRRPHALTWALGQEWTLVPGVWRLEIWDGNRKLLSHQFTLVRP